MSIGTFITPGKMYALQWRPVISGSMVYIVISIRPCLALALQASDSATVALQASDSATVALQASDSETVALQASDSETVPLQASDSETVAAVLSSSIGVTCQHVVFLSRP